MLLTSTRSKLNFLIKHLEQGNQLVCEGGYTLLWSPEHDEPGFLVKRYVDMRELEPKIMQIGSDVAWITLVKEAAKLNEMKMVELALKAVVEK
jgi:hypothetical protein